MRAAALSLLLAAATVLAQQAPTFTEAPVYVTAIDLIAEVHDRAGNVPADLTPADFIVLEDGQEKPVIGVEYLKLEVPATKVALPAPVVADSSVPAPAAPVRSTASDWQIVVYFDCYLSSETNRRSAAQSIEKQLDDLTQLGTVEIVVADPDPALLLQATRDGAAIRAALHEVTTKHSRPNRLLRHRRRFIDERELSAGQGDARVVAFLRPYIAEEIQMMNRFRWGLNDWMSHYPRHTPRALMLISDGFELDPGVFYSQSIGSNASPQLLIQVQREAAEYNLDRENEKTAELLASGGWITISTPGGFGAAGEWIDDASRSGVGRTRDLIRLGSAQTKPTFLINHNRQPLEHYADATGGAVLANASKLHDAVASLAQRVKITYQVARPPDGRVRKVEVKARRANLRVRTSQWASSTTAEEVASARVASLLRGRDERGDIPLKAKIEWVTKERGGRFGGLLFVNADLEELAPILRDAKPTFRVTIAARGGGQAFAVHRTVTEWDRASMSFAYSAPITAPNGKISIAVSVEELGTGAWGAAVVESK